MTDFPAMTLSDLTDGKIDGNGAFDKLMQATKAHLDAEFKKGAIKGAEYSEVYLGQVQAVLNTGLQFLSIRHKIALEAELLSTQVELAKAQLLQVGAQTELVRAQIEAAKVDKVLTEAQAAKVNAETLNVPKVGLQMEAQTDKLITETANAVKEGTLLVAQLAKVEAETLNIPKQGLQMDAQTDLTKQQKVNEVQQHEVLVAQECLLKSQFDATSASTIKTGAETTLLNQKTVTEKAQVSGLGVDADSVVGRQKELYLAQKQGFTRDAEQKGAKILIDTWNVRRTTDDGTVADGVNMLNDATIGRAVQALMKGINA
jgi:hypothetical protein